MTDLDGKALIADLDRSRLHEMFYYMVLGRVVEERLETLLQQGHVKGGLYRSLGQEAGAVGSAFALRRRDDGTGDIIAQTIRATCAVFLMGGTPLQYFQQYLARGTGPTRGKEANVHWCDFDRGLVGPVSPLGTMVEVMAGITLAFRLRGEPRVGVVYGSDGASSTGAWHEGVNFAAVQRCPMVIAFEANRWAFSTPTEQQTRVASFVEKAAGYGIAAESVDGNDVLAVYDATRRAVERARRGDGVTLVEMRTYRRKGHAQHDPQEYVPAEEIAEWEARDPVDGFGRRLLAEGWASRQELDDLVSQADRVAREAAEQAVADPAPEGKQALDDVQVDRPARPPWTRAQHPSPTLA